jgi:prepilin-type N-terminal cleavage/methylation domain-containing protein
MDRRYSTSHGARRGFTLIEAMLTTIIVGVAFTAMLQLLAVGTVNNLKAGELTTGVSLARNIREYTLNTKYANLPALNNVSYSPPKDSRGVAISSLSGWQQKITVQSVNPDNIQQDILDATPDAVRVTVVVNHNSQKVCDLTWYVFDGTP